jgi:ribosomal protein RSM22 (predicted rRNA methylase)
VLMARDTLLSEGAHIAAPCPHVQQCPIKTLWPSGDKWCHFSVRVERSRMHRMIKPDAVLGYEDEKFSYVVASRDKPVMPRYRITGNPRGKKIVEAEACGADGRFEELRVAKSSPDFKAFRKAEWGDGV